MKIKKVVDICRREGVARIYEDANDTQWLSCGYACYPLYEVPELSEVNSLQYSISPISKEKKRYLSVRRSPRFSARRTIIRASSFVRNFRPIYRLDQEC